jgi:glucose/arabinose dehydrogenase
MVRFDQEGLVTSYQPFITGFAQNEEQENGSFWGEWLLWHAVRRRSPRCAQPVESDGCLAAVCAGRPIRLQQLFDGSLLISDDYAGTIYRVTYR